MKHIDADLLRKEIETLKDEYTDIAIDSQRGWVNANFVIDDLERLQSQIDSLQQEQPNDIRTEIEEYYGEDLALEDERTKAAYHFFSAGKAFELREYEEEREKHITDLLDNFQKGMNAGYEKAISELKEGKVECSPVMKELIDKLFGIGNTFNFGFGPKNIQQEQLPGIEEHGIPGKDFIPVEWVDACEKYGKWKIVQQEQPSLPDNLDEAAEEYARLDDEGVWKDGGKYKGFKAGAEWMAGQGYTVDGIVICDKELTRGYKDIVMRIPDELKVDDKVTIQIRKREE